jgi:hypothetical protein
VMLVLGLGLIRPKCLALLLALALRAIVKSVALTLLDYSKHMNKATGAFCVIKMTTVCFVEMLPPLPFLISHAAGVMTFNERLINTIAQSI